MPGRLEQGACQRRNLGFPWQDRRREAHDPGDLLSAEGDDRGCLVGLALPPGASIRLQEASPTASRRSPTHRLTWGYSLSCGSCTRELWPPFASLPVGKSVPPAEKAPETAPPTRVGSLLRQGSPPRGRARGHTQKSLVPPLVPHLRLKDLYRGGLRSGLHCPWPPRVGLLLGLLTIGFSLHRYGATMKLNRSSELHGT